MPRWRCRLGRSGLTLMLVLLAALFAAPGARGQARTASPPPPGGGGFEGTTDVKTLPPPGPPAPGAREVPIGVPDPDLLRQKKRELEEQRLRNLPGSTATPSSGAGSTPAARQPCP